MAAAPSHQTAASDRSPHRTGARLRLLAVLVVGIGAGAAISAGLPGQLVGGAGAEEVVGGNPGEVEVELHLPPAEPARSSDGSLRASTPADAVAGFLVAEAEGRLEDAYLHLTAAEQEEFFSATGYVAAHADLLPPVLGYRVVHVSEADGTAVVTTDVSLRPSLDPIIGLVPSAAEVTWTAVSQDGGWAVELTTAQLVPRYPDDARAAQDVAEWAGTRQACGDPGVLEESQLRGSAGLASDLCAAAGDVRVGAVAPLPDIDGGPYLAAYGGEVADWARTVEVEAPLALRAVVAPVGDRWTVIGVLAPSGGR
jgi:hypothetical protein